ncbi:MAG: DUF721 domain-containing protein [Coriobacteriia bacterium]|nr:DUF721 domain-containing protein [Coriobacteriia bacterium]
MDPHGKRHESKAVQVWPEVAGSEIVKHTRGFAMREGELVVFVDSPAWANELTLMAERLREGINSRIGQNSVRGIRFAVSKKVQEERHREALHLEDEEFYQPDRTKPVALSTEELDQARYIAEAVREPELREKALRVMIKDLEWKKGVRDTKEAERATGGPRDTGSSPS